MSIKKHIPNLISLANATSGAVGIYLACTYSITAGVWCMIAGMIFDFFDGFTARKLGVFSPLGKDLDSLSDAISFGVLPATLLCLALMEIGSPVPFIAFVIAPASVYRLAKFNHDERQSSSFIGLPTPANALFWAGIATVVSQNREMIISLPRMIEYKVQGGLPVLVLLFSWLLISEVPMFSLKKVGQSWRDNLPLIIVIVVMLPSLLIWQFSGLSIGIGAYVLVNLVPYLRHRFS